MRAWHRRQHEPLPEINHNAPPAATGTLRLEIEPDQWWRGRLDGWLVIDATRVEPIVDEDGTSAWVQVAGWRVLPGGERTRTLELVRTAAVPPALLATL